MKNKLRLILPILAFLVLLSMASIANAANWVVPTGIVKLVNISLYNYQTTAITAGTQVMLTFNGLNYTSYFNGNLINFEVFNGVTGNILYTWFEGNEPGGEQQLAGFNGVSNNIIWVTLPSGIAASTDAVNVVSIGFIAMTSTALNGNNMGIAPQIECASGCPQSSYGQYDNGANVFPILYQNFTSAAEASGWVTTGSGAISDGASIGSGAAGRVYTSSTYGLVASQVVDYLGYGSSSTTNHGQGFGYNQPGINGATWSLNNNFCSGNADFQDGSEGALCAPYNAWTIYTTYYPSAETGTYQYNYGPTDTVSGTLSIALPLGFWITGSISPPVDQIQWVRIRTEPPNGVQPTQTYGPVQSPAVPTGTTLTIATNPATFGQSDLMTATVAPGDGGDTVELLINGNVIASGMGSAASTICSPICLSLGAYTINAYDVNLGTSAIQGFNVIMPITVQNTIGTRTITIPYAPIKTKEYYPLIVSAANTNSSISFTVNQVLSGTNSILYTNVKNFSYMPPPNQITGNYLYQIYENQPSIASNYPIGLPIMVTNAITNMTSITNAIATNAPIIQDYSNLANFSKGSFTALPASWKLWSYPNTFPSAYGVNTIQGSVFASNILTFPVNIQLTYSNPSTSFNITLTNNPAVQTTITTNALQFIPSNTVPGAAPNTRLLLNISTRDEQTNALIFSNTTLTQTWSVNNYTITSTSSFISATFNVYTAHSNYINQTFMSKGIATSAVQTNYLESTNNYCPTKIINQAATLYQYIVYDPNAEFGEYTVTISAGFSAVANGDYLQILKGLSPESSLQVQQVSISQTSFAIPLLPGQTYGFTIVGPNCQLIYATNFSTQTNPIYITLPQNTTVQQIAIPNPTIKCTVTYNSTAVNDMLVCTGSDASSLIDKWNVTLYNESSFEIPMVLGTSINGGTFYYQNTILSNVVDYTAIVSYSTANGIFGSKTFQFPVQYVPGFESTFDGFATFIILLVFVGFGVGLAQTQEGSVHAMSNTLFLLAVGIFVCFMLGFTAGLGILINSGAIILCIAIALYVMSEENKSIYYRG